MFHLCKTFQEFFTFGSLGKGNADSCTCLTGAEYKDGNCVDLYQGF